MEARHAKRTPVLDRWIGKFRDRFRATSVEAEDSGSTTAGSTCAPRTRSSAIR